MTNKTHAYFNQGRPDAFKVEKEASKCPVLNIRELKPNSTSGSKTGKTELRNYARAAVKYAKSQSKKQVDIALFLDFYNHSKGWKKEEEDQKGAASGQNPD